LSIISPFFNVDPLDQSGAVHMNESYQDEVEPSRTQEISSLRTLCPGWAGDLHHRWSDAGPGGLPRDAWLARDLDLLKRDPKILKTTPCKGAGGRHGCFESELTRRANHRHSFIIP
jgi:hypothetical protein